MDLRLRLFYRYATRPCENLQNVLFETIRQLKPILPPDLNHFIRDLLQICN